jgi:hypothetical protein
MAQAAQTYSIVIVDKNLYATLLQTEDYHQYTAVNGIDPYTTDPTGEPVLGGILEGQAFSVNTMQGFPWSSLELLDDTKINPLDASQPIRPAVTGITGQHTGAMITMHWPDDPLAASWRVYNKAGSVTLSSALSTGAAITSLPVNALPQQIPLGSRITFTSGGNTQTFVTSANAAVSATSVTVTSQTPNFAYPTNSTTVLRQLLTSTSWYGYTVWNPPTIMTFAISAVNGGGEGPLSLDFTPPLPLRSRRRERSRFG